MRPLRVSSLKAYKIDTLPPIQIALLVGLAGLWILVIRDTWRAIRPARYLLAGRHAEARQAAEDLERSWLRVFKGLRHSAKYVKGCALHLEGDLEGSLAAIKPLHDARLNEATRYAVCSIDAASLVLLDRDLARAKDLLEEAARTKRPPEDMLLLAHAKYALGDEEGALKLFRAAGSHAKVKEEIFHTLRGLFLLKLDQRKDAERDFEIAAKSKRSNVYVTRARALLERNAGALEIEGPSSLAPQVVAKDQGAPTS